MIWKCELYMYDCVKKINWWRLKSKIVDICIVSPHLWMEGEFEHYSSDSSKIETKTIWQANLTTRSIPVIENKARWAWHSDVAVHLPNTVGQHAALGDPTPSLGSCGRPCIIHPTFNYTSNLTGALIIPRHRIFFGDNFKHKIATFHCSNDRR